MLGTNVVAMVLAGGEGVRLRPLTCRRCKPAVPFGGSFRVVDFALLNCAASRVRAVYILTQYQAPELRRYCRERWRDLSRARGQRLETLQAKERGGRYLGTADAVYQNIDVLRTSRATDVLILSGDQIYRADYEALVRVHVERQADVTILTGEVNAEDARDFGVLETSSNGRVTQFVEKPGDPSLYARGGKCAINLGVYCFRSEFLHERLLVDASRRWSSHDFGRDILPAVVGRRAVLACPLATVCPDAHPYWRDVGTVDSFFNSHLDLLRPDGGFELADPRWSARSPFRAWIPRRVPVRASIGGRLVKGWNLVSQRVEMRRAQVVNSVVSTGAKIHPGATVEECLVFPGAEIGRGARLRRVIVEEGVHVSPGSDLGYGGRSAEVPTSLGGVVVYTGSTERPLTRRCCEASFERRVFLPGARPLSPESSTLTPRESG